jgi:hypothetical protein
MSSYWGIIAGPDPAHPEDTDAEGWEWTLKQLEGGEERRFRCVVTGPGKSPTAHPRSREAASTQGRSEAERVLEDPDPPREVMFGADGPLSYS